MLIRTLIYFAAATAFFLFTLAASAHFDRLSMEQLAEVRRQARQAENAYRGQSSVGERPLWGKAILPPTIGRGWPELLFWAAYPLGLVGGVGYLIARGVTAPLRQLTRSSETLARGLEPEPLDTGQPGAVGALAREFADLARVIQSREMELKESHLAISRAAEAKARLLQQSHQLFRQELQSMRELVVRECGARPVWLRNLDQLSHLVDDLGDLAALERPLQAHPVEAVQLVDEAVAMVRPQALAKGLELRSRLPDSQTLRGDPHRLRQLCVNLLVNAVKYTDAGFVEIGLEGSPGQARIYVKDSGCGLGDEDLPQLLDEFRQASPHSAQGVGLGLFICGKIVELHGGTLRLSSEAQGGTLAVVDLPIDCTKSPQNS